MMHFFEWSMKKFMKLANSVLSNYIQVYLKSFKSLCSFLTLCLNLTPRILFNYFFTSYKFCLPVVPPLSECM